MNKDDTSQTQPCSLVANNAVTHQMQSNSDSAIDAASNQEAESIAPPSPSSIGDIDRHKLTEMDAKLAGSCDGEITLKLLKFLRDNRLPFAFRFILFLKMP